MANDMAALARAVSTETTIRTNFRRPVYCLLGVPIDAVDLQQAGHILTEAITSGTRCVMTTPNLNNLVAMQRDARFRDAVIRNELSVADGMPLIWISRLLGIPLKERVAGSDLFERLASPGGPQVSVYFFGGPDGAAQAASERINATAGSMRCAGFRSPGFGDVDTLSHPEMIEDINRSGADFLIIAMGTAKGHVWIERNRALLKTQVVSHLGAVINFAGGTLSRAPSLMRRLGFEWLWRIKEEPALWRRYWADGTAFLPLVFTRVLPCAVERVKTALFGRGQPAKVSAYREGATVHLTLSGAWHSRDLGPLREVLEAKTQLPGDIEIDVAGLGQVDEAFLGLLMLLYGHQSKLGRGFSIRSASTKVRGAFRRRCAEFLLAGIPPAGRPPVREGRE